MKQKITVPSDVYVEGFGVGRVDAYRRGYDDDGLPYEYYRVWRGLACERHSVEHVYRAVATFAGWLYVGHDGILRPVPVVLVSNTVSGRWTSLHPNMQNIPIGRHK